MGRAVCGIHEALWLARLHQAGVGALYVHLPFCARKCAYCDFASWETAVDDPLIGGYLHGCERLLAQAADAGLLGSATTAYVGGGTPTLAGAALPELVAAIMDAAPRVRELSCEANPDSLSDELLARLPEAGCTRLSIGVQSLDDGELALLGRIHTAAQARERLRAAVRSGLRVSCDLMCALPAQTEESWRASLSGVLACGVGHVSVYPLQIEEDTPLGRRYADAACPWNDSGVQAARMELARELLVDGGLERYEVASYARAGEDCAHNQAYWTAVPYLGIGTHASSMLTREGYHRLLAVAPQLPEAPEEARRVRLTCVSGRREVAEARGWDALHFELELLSEAQAAAEDLMLGMRLVRGVGPGLLEHARNVLGTEAVEAAGASCAARGLVYQQDDGSWAPTHEGWLLGNELYGALWDLAPGTVATAEA